MSGASFILAINLFIAALFALAFFLVAVTNRSDRVASWFSLAYVFGIAYIACEFVLPLEQFAILAYVTGFAAFHGAMTAVYVGICRRYRRSVPWATLAVVGAVAIVANWVLFGDERTSLLRMLAYQGPYAILQAMAGWVIFRSHRRQPMDLALLGIFVLSAAQFLSKPYVALMTGGPGDSAQSYIASTYALYSQSLGAVLQVAVGLLMLMLLVRDLLVEATARSETDPLSGVLNRRGFEDRALPRLANASATRVPVSLVAADLDGFKLINDAFGHDVGDEVIVAFAGLLHDCAPAAAIVARIGGEEFAVLLPNATLHTGRLFAEAVRMQFTALRIPGIPADLRCTASFGIAETGGGESLSDLRRRADAALYAAKRSGRDRVCIAPDSGTDSMPHHPLASDAAIRSA
jgi:diguanylate cyclase (GGDEF)-like protein